MNPSSAGASTATAPTSTGTDYYARLPIFHGFNSIMDPARYRPLPDDWLIGLTDVVGSTQAIDDGRYKAVNTAGASVIAAVSNALQGRSFPFVFGGDGASFAVSSNDEAVARAALASTSAWVRDELQLELRAALVPVAAAKENGFNVSVARFAPSKNVSYAMFAGGGLAWAESAMRDGRFSVPPAAPGVRPDLAGLSCRWNDIPAEHGLILSLLVAPVTIDDPAFRKMIEALLVELENSTEVARPVPDGAPGVSWPPAGLDLEARASGRSGDSLFMRRVKVVLRTLIGYFVMRFGIRIGAFDPAVYRREVVENSDFRKYDDNLRMTLDCTPELADRIERRLEQAEAAKILRFGIHRQPAAIMTCIVPSIAESNHVHFVDGAAGGYALAARRLNARAMNDLSWLSISELAHLLATGAVSSREIVDACLDRITALDQRLHAFIDVYSDDARFAALKADQQRAAGQVCGPLHGLPIALKDLVHVRGRMTTAGSRDRPFGIANETAFAWERLQAAGMIALGKTHLVEFAFGGWGRNAPMGAPWNPWDTHVHRVAGGSSSGSAVAVAAGLAPAAIGSDTGGSIRIPSALCGLTGLKPTYGLISLAGVFPLATTLDSLGPIAHNVDDVALLTAAMAGHDLRDPTTLAAPAIDFAAVLRTAPDIRGMRITALAVEQFPSLASKDVLQARDDTIAALRALGAIVEEARAPIDFQDVMVKSGRIIAAEAYTLHRAYIEDESLTLDPWVRRRTLGGKAITATEHDELLAAHARAAADYAEWMQGCDALLTPTLPIAATPLTDVDEATTPLATFTRAANFLRACALSLPAGLDTQGLPIGMQLMGAPYGDATLVKLGRAFQQTTYWHRRRPDLSAWDA